MAPAASISGSVVDQLGRPLSGACVWVAPSSQGTTGPSRVDAAGRYAVGGLTAGDRQVTVDLECRSPGAPGTGVHQGPLTIVGAESNHVDLRLAPGQAVVLDLVAVRPTAP